MDNPSRSERTRTAVIQSALVIIARDGAAHLTLDAIARESGISKGGLIHQFRTKKEVLKALLEQHAEFLESISRKYLAEHACEHAEPQLAAEIVTMREAAADPHSLAFAILGALAQEPDLLNATRDASLAKLDVIRREAADPDLATLRWKAALGLTLSALLGLCPLTKDERERLFESLLDHTR